jgi:hypothetical protein
MEPKRRPDEPHFANVLHRHLIMARQLGHSNRHYTLTLAIFGDGQRVGETINMAMGIN